MKKIKMFDLTIILPCYNEEENIDILFSNFYKLKNKLDNICILFFNNGSSDNTLKRIIENINKYQYKNFKYASIEKNNGYGYGLKIALKETESKFIGISHADLQIPIKETIDIANKYLNSNTENLFMGKRKGRDAIDNLFTRGMLIFVNLLTKNKFLDINAQPKFINNIKEYNFSNFPDDFNFDLHLLLKTKNLNKKIEYFEIEFLRRTAGKSKGGGSILGKFKLTYSTLKYLIKKNIND